MWADLVSDFEPPVNPPKEIPDPSNLYTLHSLQPYICLLLTQILSALLGDTKPEDWDDRATYA